MVHRGERSATAAEITDHAGQEAKGRPEGRVAALDPKRPFGRGIRGSHFWLFQEEGTSDTDPIDW